MQAVSLYFIDSLLQFFIYSYIYSQPLYWAPPMFLLIQKSLIKMTQLAFPSSTFLNTGRQSMHVKENWEGSNITFVSLKTVWPREPSKMVFLRMYSYGATCWWVVQTHLEGRDKASVPALITHAKRLQL